MAAVDTGKSFANGEQLTAAKLNQMFGNSTFAAGAVDNSTMTVNSLGQLAVNQVTSSNIAANALNLDDIQQIDTNKFLGRTSAETGNVEQVDISTIANLLRPKYVVATGATHALTLQNQANGTTKTYNIADFEASGQSGFNTNQIIAVFGSAMTISQGSFNEINVTSNGQTSRISRASLAGGSGQVEDAASFYLPINSGQTDIQFGFTVSNSGATTFNEVAIKGFVIQENLT